MSKSGRRRERSRPRETMSEWTIGAVLDVIAEVVPDRAITVCGERRRTFAGAGDRTRRAAQLLSAARAALLLSDDDRSTAPALSGAVSLDDALSQGNVDQNVTPSPDDLL